MNTPGSLAVTRRTIRSLTVSRPSRLGALAVVVACVLALPVIVVVSSVSMPTHGTWSHLAATVLPEYIANSLIIMAGVAFGVIVGGVSTAWFTVMCRFPGETVLRMGAAAAHGSPRLRHGLCVYRFAAIRRAGANVAPRDDGLGAA